MPLNNLSALITDAVPAVRADAAGICNSMAASFRTQARDLWNRDLRATYDLPAGRDLHRPINQLEQSGLRRDHRRDEPLRRNSLCRPHGACLHQPVAAGQTRSPDALAGHGTGRRCAAVRMMDNVADASKFPPPQQEAEARRSAASVWASPGLRMRWMLGLRYGVRPDAVGQTV